MKTGPAAISIAITEHRTIFSATFSATSLQAPNSLREQRQRTTCHGRWTGDIV